jgi:hypothetical protein
MRDADEKHVHLRSTSLISVSLLVASRVSVLLLLTAIVLHKSDARRHHGPRHHAAKRSLRKAGRDDAFAAAVKRIGNEPVAAAAAIVKGHKKKGKANFMNMLFDRKLLT